ncbi:MAG: hypothetical protein ABH851_02125 [Methanobacteriota archaeon]
MQIENIGSHNISKVWFNATYPESNPFATGEISDDSANFVVLANESATVDDEYFFINRKEYNETRSLVYLTDPNGVIPPAADWMYGRFRNASDEFFWMINKSDVCNKTKNLYIGDLSHKKSSSGTIDFSGSGVVTIALAENGAYGVGDIDSGNLTGYCVAVNATCDNIFLYKWNMDMPGAGTDCDNALYAHGDPDDDASVNGALVPGESIVMRIKVRVPYGVYEGSTTQGVITVIASDVID